MWPTYLDRDPIYTPTEAEIEIQCRAIRAGWSVGEERKRRVWTLTDPLQVALIPMATWSAATEARAKSMRGE